MDKIIKLKEEIYKADYAYYELAKPIISDSKYDLLVKELFELTGEIPEKPSGFLNDKFTKIKHHKKMLSLENSYSFEDILKFKTRIKKEKENWNEEVCLQNKLDGLACSLIYESGLLKLAKTRGDGEYGEDITENVIQCLNVPLMLPESINCEVRGELIISKSNFVKINEELEEDKKYSNPRNLCSGTMRSLDSKVIKERFVEFVPYDLIDIDNNKIKTHEGLITKINLLGFDISKLNNLSLTIDYLKDVIEQRELNRHKLDYEIDGQVIKINDLELQEEIGYTSKFPKYSIAYKFETEKIKTKVESIDYQIGKTGIITPVANLTPVEISGSIVKRASLHNFDEIERKDIRVNDYVLVEKAAEIIPYITEVCLEDRTEDCILVTKPTNCPYCNSEVKQFKDTISICCSNENCDEIKIQKLIYKTSKDCLDINGLSEKTIRTLYELGFLKSLKDLIYLKESKEQLYMIKGYGKKSIDRILESIEKSKDKPAATILNTLDIHLIGRSMSKKLIKELKDINLIINSTEEELCNIEDFSINSYNSIQTWKSNKENLDNLKLLEDNNFNTKEETKEIEYDIANEFYNKTICITGSFESYNRTELSKLLESKGAKITNSISKKTDILICGEKAGSKLEKAEKLKIKIIKEGELIV